MKLKFATALLAATAFATPALAQHGDANFSGVRVEGRVGWDNVQSGITLPDPDDDDEFISVTGDESNVGYGVEVGYDAMIGNHFLIGAYGGVDFSDNEFCSEIVGDDLGCASTGRNFTLGVRAGAVINPNVLIYARGGYSNGEVELNYDSDVDDDDADELFAASETRDGYHLGAGVEFALSRNLFAKVEYNYTNYGTLSLLDDDDAIGDIRVERHQAVAGFGFRF